MNNKHNIFHMFNEWIEALNSSLDQHTLAQQTCAYKQKQTLEVASLDILKLTKYGRKMYVVLHHKVVTRKQIRRTLNTMMRLTKIKYTHKHMLYKRDWLQIICQCEGKTCRMIWRFKLKLSICKNRQCCGCFFSISTKRNFCWHAVAK